MQDFILGGLESSGFVDGVNWSKPAEICSFPNRLYDLLVALRHHPSGIF